MDGIKLVRLEVSFESGCWFADTSVIDSALMEVRAAIRGHGPIWTGRLTPAANAQTRESVIRACIARHRQFTRQSRFAAGEG